MSHGEFEKQVRDKMNEIHLQPSESVWNRVEQGLDAGKKRRRIIFWAPLIGVLVIGWFLFNNQFLKQEKLVQNSDTRQTDTQSAINQPETLSDKSFSPSSPSSEVERSLAASGPVHPETSSANDEKITNVNKSPRSGDQTVQIPQRKKVVADRNEIRQANRIPQTINSTNPDAIDAVENNQEARGNTISGVLPSNILMELTPQKNAWKNITLPVINFSENQEKITGNLGENIGDNNNSKYAFTVNVSGGLSQEKNGRLLAFSQSNRTDFQTPLYSSPNTRYKAAPIDPGIYLSAGIGVERRMGDHWALSTGLQFSRFSNSIMVGNRMQQERQVFTGNSTPSTISTYYTPAPIKRYSMHYDFIEVPIALQYIPGKGKMKLIAGSSVSALVGSNALHFDAANGIYFKNNDLLNRMQVSVSTGMQFRIPVKNSNRLYIGPTFRYQVSGMLKDNGTEKHLWSGAIQANWKLK